MPVNSQPDRFGGTVVVLDPENDTPMVRVLHKDEPPPPGDRYKAHFTTCKTNQDRKARSANEGNDDGPDSRAADSD
jgi:hypothetical protein